MNWANEVMPNRTGWEQKEHKLHRYLLIRSRKRFSPGETEVWFAWYETMCQIVLQYSVSKSGKRQARKVIAYLHDINNAAYPWEYSSRDRKRVPDGAHFLNAVDDLFSLAVSPGSMAHAKRMDTQPYSSLRVVEAAVAERLPVTSIMAASVLILGTGHQG